MDTTDRLSHMNDKGPVLSRVLRYWRDKDVCLRALWCSLAAAILVWGLIELFVLGTRDIRESCLLTTGVFDAEFSYRHRRELVFQSLPCAQGINLIPL